MADLILRTRLDVLRTNLKRVADLGSNDEGSIEHLRSELRKLLDLPEDRRLNERLVTIEGLLAKVRTALFYKDEAQIKICLDDIGAEVRGIQSQLEEARRAAGQITARALPIHGDGPPWPALQEGLVGEADRQTKVLEEEKWPLVSQAGDAEQHDPAEAARLRKEAWDWYSTRGYDEGSQVFAEYLDFLSGLALRDTGLDQGMCLIADRLIRSAGRLPGGVNWESLTIPAQREALKATLAKFVRLGFPEWTIWALPLAAHELGHVAVTVEKFRQFIDRRATVAGGRVDESLKSRLSICLADAFATFVMGPAYACALILIRLDPLKAFDAADDQLTQKRAHVVLAMLRSMDEAGAVTERGPYARIAERLETEWTEAVAQARSVGSLTPQDQVDIQAWVRHTSETMTLYKALKIEWWPRIEKIAEALDSERVEQLDVEVTDEVRFVLNAAWKRRLDADRQTDLDAVAKATARLSERIEEATRPKTDEGWAAPRSAWPRPHDSLRPRGR